MAEGRAVWKRGWLWLDRHPRLLLVGLFVLCLAAFAATIPLPHADGQLVGSDGVYYYAYLPSLVLDRDLDLANQYARLLPADAVARMQPTATGLVPNAYALGPALLWLPFFLLGHGAALLLRAAGAPLATDGTGYIYQAPAMAGSIVYGSAGLFLVYRAGRRYFAAGTSAWTAALLCLATNLVYYLIAEPSMSHALSFFAVAVFFERWLAWRPAPTPGRWALLGLAGGLVALVRLPDATYLALPLLDALAAAAPQGRAALRRLLPGVAAFGLAALAAFAPQMAAWQGLYGSPLRSGYLYTSGPTFYWLQPHLAEVLFSPLHGLFTWHPLYLLAALGLICLARRDRRLALLVVLGLAMQVYVVGAWRDWGQGDAFGGRMFVASLPGLALGLGALLEWATAQGALPAAGVASTVLVFWNALFLIQYRLGYIPMSTPPTLEQFTLGKLTMLADLWRRLGGRAGLRP